MKNILHGIVFAATLTAVSAEAHHPAADIVDEDIYVMIDSMVADTPHADLVFADMGGGSRVHTVSKRDTLYSIARMYYNGDHTRWKEIYQANRTKINNPNMIRVGQELVIP